MRINQPDFRATNWEVVEGKHGKVEISICETLEEGRWEPFIVTREIVRK